MKILLYGGIVMSLMVSAIASVSPSVLLLALGLFIITIIQSCLLTILVMGLYSLSDDMDRMSKIILDLNIKSVEFTEETNKLDKEEV